MKKAIFLTTALLFGQAIAQENDNTEPEQEKGDIRDIKIADTKSKFIKATGNTGNNNQNNESAGNNAGGGLTANDVAVLINRVDFLEQTLDNIQNTPQQISADSASIDTTQPRNNNQSLQRNENYDYNENKNYYTSVSQNNDGEFKENYNEDVIYKGVITFGNEKKLSYYDKISKRGGIASIGDIVPKPFVTGADGESKSAKINEIGDDYVVIGYKKILFSDNIYSNHYK